MPPKKPLLSAPSFSRRTGSGSSRITKAIVANRLVGKAKVMSYKDIVEAQAKIDAKEAIVVKTKTWSEA